MRSRSKFKWLVVVALVAAAAGTAGAQNAQGTTDGQVGFQRKPQLTPQQQVSEANNQVTRMEQGAAAIRRQLEEARAARDVVKTLCLNDKLNQIDVAVRSARERRQSLEAAAQRQDADLASHEFTILTVLRQRSDQLTAEANQCIGQEAAFVGESAVSSTIDPGLAPDEGWKQPDDGKVVEPPSCASCVK